MPGKTNLPKVQKGNLVKLDNVHKHNLEKSEQLLDHVEHCVFDNARPSPAKVKAACKLVMAVYEKAAELFVGERVYLWEKLGWAYHLLGDMRKAEQCLRIQAKLQPGCADAYINLGNFYENGEIYSLALKAYLDGLVECPGDEFLSYNLAHLLSRMGIYEEAINYINDAIAKNPLRAYNHKIKGDILKKGGELQEAACSYQRALELFSSGDDSEKRDAFSSLVGIRKALNVNPKLPNHLFIAKKTTP